MQFRHTLRSHHVQKLIHIVTRKDIIHTQFFSKVPVKEGWNIIFKNKNDTIHHLFDKNKTQSFG